MTCSYSEMNQHDALYMIARAYPGGVEALAQRMRMTTPVLYNKLRPGVDSHHVTFEQVSEIVELCAQAHVPNAYAPLHALNWRHGHAAFAIPLPTEADSGELIQNVCRAVKEFGDVASCISESTADNFIDQREFMRMESEFEGVFAALTELRARIHTKVKQQEQKARVDHD